MIYCKILYCNNNLKIKGFSQINLDTIHQHIYNPSIYRRKLKNNVGLTYTIWREYK